MPFPFVLVCDLLDDCQKLCFACKSPARAVLAWFSRHRDYIDAYDTDLPAFLSTLLPEKRTDRVYGIQASSLERIVGRTLLLGSSRLSELARYKQAGLGLDLGDAVEKILAIIPNTSLANDERVTIEEIDGALHDFASQTRWSSPAIRNQRVAPTHGSRNRLDSIYRRVSAREAKWLTRLVLKNLQLLPD